MEQFRQVGEVLGSMRALMAFRDEIQINRRQCCLMLELFASAYDSVEREMKENLRFDERESKWKFVEAPLMELLRIYREADRYLRISLEIKDWNVKMMMFYQNTDAVGFYIHNLLCTIPVVVEAIEIAGEMAGIDATEMEKKRILVAKKYQREWKDPNLFQWRFGKQYLVSKRLEEELNGVLEEDRWILQNKMRERKMSNIQESRNSKLLPVKILLDAGDYQVRRRLGNGSSQYKEIRWFGESFVLRHMMGKSEKGIEISFPFFFSLSHPHLLPLLCGFKDDERDECFLITELMNRDLGNHMKEMRGRRRRTPFSILVAVDIMLQIARGLEYLHSKNICHGQLSPSKILVNPSTVEGYLHVKITGFGPFSDHRRNSLAIWSAPEVLNEADGSVTPSEKADVYSFAMVCFEILTGKVPFEDAHLQGEKMCKNIRQGERPLFPFDSPPKFITGLTRKCWHSDPDRRPTFASICRILRYTKRFLIMNSDHESLPESIPVVDFCDIEARLSTEFSSWRNCNGETRVSEIPFQMFVYRVEERMTAMMRSDDGSEVEREDVSVVITPAPVMRTPPLPEIVNHRRTTAVKRSACPGPRKQAGMAMIARSRSHL